MEYHVERTILTTTAARRRRRCLLALSPDNASSRVQLAAASHPGKFYEKGNVRIHYQDACHRFPLLDHFRPAAELYDARCSRVRSTRRRVSRTTIAASTAALRNANAGQSSGRRDRPDRGLV